MGIVTRIKAGSLDADHVSVESSRQAGRYDATVNGVLPAACGLLAAVTAVAAAANLFAPEARPRAVMPYVSGATAVGFLVLLAVLSRRQLPDRWAHPVMAAICLLLASESVLHLYLGDEPWMTSNLLLVIVGAGAVILDRWWLAGTIAVVGAIWAVGMLRITEPQSRHWLLSMCAAVVLAVGINVMRRNGLDRLFLTVERAERASVEDDLTGLLNRRGLALVGAQIVAAARRSGNAVHCVFLDVDGLKDVNDRLGHAAGDRVLLAVADAIRLTVRSGDVVARWGGDEFCVVGPGPGTAPIDLERRVSGKVVELPPDDVPGWRPQVSAGSAMLAPWDDGDLSSLLEQADREMYRRRGLRREVPLERQPSPE